ncbi:hypothetical protein D3C78_743950 [compost metagenome]
MGKGVKRPSPLLLTTSNPLFPDCSTTAVRLPSLFDLTETSDPTDLSGIIKLPLSTVYPSITFELDRSNAPGLIQSRYSSSVVLLATFSTTQLFGPRGSGGVEYAQAPSNTAIDTADSEVKALRIKRTPVVLNMIHLPE